MNLHQPNSNQMQLMLETGFIKAFNALSVQINQTAKEKGWWDGSPVRKLAKAILASPREQGLPQDVFKLLRLIENEPIRNRGEMIALMHSELSEMLEGIRKDLVSDHIEGFSMEEEEGADLMIRLMDYGIAHNLRFAEAMIAKMAFNKGRELMHGGKKF